eukprot:m.112143 g.112143  ORF g.112143 m.112143 type:complete len:416 (-) comp16162_c0_seq3:231-1478(-)
MATKRKGKTAPVGRKTNKRARRPAEQLAPDDLPPEAVEESLLHSQLLAFERRVDALIQRKRLDLVDVNPSGSAEQQACKRILRLFVSNTHAHQGDPESTKPPKWSLRIEGRLVDDPSILRNAPKKRFSSFFKHVLVEVNPPAPATGGVPEKRARLVEWTKSATSEADGFEIVRRGSEPVAINIALQLDYQPPKFKLSKELRVVLNMHTATRSTILMALWQYIKARKMQNSREKEYIDCDGYFKRIFGKARLKFSELPTVVERFLLPPDPIVLPYVINVDPSVPLKQEVYDIEVEVNELVQLQSLTNPEVKAQLLSLESQAGKMVSELKMQRERRDFFLSFATEPQTFISAWLASQNADQQASTQVGGMVSSQRLSEAYQAPWAQSAVLRYFSSKLNQKKVELQERQQQFQKLGSS